MHGVFTIESPDKDMSEDYEENKDELTPKELPEGSAEHIDYKPADAKDGNVRHRLSGMYQTWFLDYASYVILERAVPHVADGLKPVQRRILHTMRRMEDGRYNKVANIVGEAMKFHPHGDASIKDALVQLGQKDLLIDCQGNWGNILTGDDAAAARYIEARLTKFALDVVFNPKTTEWKQSYDGRNREPVTLPVKFPLLLAQGVEGIAVGLSSKILPHNFNELCDAAVCYLHGEEFHLYPDFQTGGSIDVQRRRARRFRPRPLQDREGGQQDAGHPRDTLRQDRGGRLRLHRESQRERQDKDSQSGGLDFGKRRDSRALGTGRIVGQDHRRALRLHRLRGEHLPQLLRH